MQVVRVEDRANIVQAVSGNSDDLCLGAAFQRETCDRRAAKVIKRDTDDARPVAGLGKRGAETVVGPWSAIRVEQYDR